MAKAKTVDCPFITVDQKGRSFILTRLPAWAFIELSYVSIRGVHDEEGAVQRYLNSRRISSIRDFTLEVGIFPNSLILNWASNTSKLKRSGNVLTVPIEARAAQVIDGQHRRAGIYAAMRQDASLKDFQVPLAIFEGLDTQGCADIFVSINTEQKPVPKSLVYDLFSEASDYIADHGVQRASDIAKYLHEEDESPYLEMIKFPGSRYERGGIALSTAVSALKPLVETKGDFDQIGISNLSDQSAIILSFFKCLAAPYGDSWLHNTNAFVYAAGFTGAIEFFKKRVIPFCTKKKSFTITTIAECVGISEDTLILQSEVRGSGGKNAVFTVYERLNEAFEIEHGTGHDFEL